MNRAFLLLSLAPLLAACESPCAFPYLNVYWSPSPNPPSAGFRVPGLGGSSGFPTELGCAAAGVDAVDVAVGGALQPCAPGYCGSGPNSARWSCDTGGVSVPIPDGGSYEVIVDGFDSTGAMIYSNSEVGGVATSTGEFFGAANCGDSAAGVFPRGLDGTLDIGYTFTPVNACGAAGSNIWFELLDHTGAVYATSTPASTTQIVCPQTISLATVPAGVYTLSKFEDGSGPTTYHADCAGPSFVHAGNETFVTTVPASATACFP